MTAAVRTHCLAPDACAAKKPTTHCRRCSATRMRHDPDIEVRRRAAADAYFALPETKAALTARIREAQKAALTDPAFVERLREQGRRQYRDYLSQPDIRARNAAPDVRRRAGERITDTRLEGIPCELRDEYRRLMRVKGLTASEARAVIDDMPGSATRAARRAIADFDRTQRARRRREREEAY